MTNVATVRKTINMIKAAERTMVAKTPIQKAVIKSIRFLQACISSTIGQYDDDERKPGPMENPYGGYFQRVLIRPHHATVEQYAVSSSSLG